MAGRNSDYQSIYTNALYAVPSISLRLKPGKYSGHLAEIMNGHGVSNAAFITAYNPCSLVLLPHFNKHRNDLLREDLITGGYIYYHGISGDRDSLWMAEESFLILGIEYMQAVYLSRRYAQNAFLFSDSSAHVFLIFTEDFTGMNK